MADVDPRQRQLVTSILDRLIDPAGGASQSRTGATLTQILADVRRDLEDLLNTRQPPLSIPPEFPETARSARGYGFPDVSSLSNNSSDEICQMIEEAIRSHEPRLRDVKANAVPIREEEPQRARFTIDAKLDLSPSPAVAFATVMDLATGYSTVKTGGADG